MCCLHVGLTDRDYSELQVLYSKHAARGLEILAFPCNNFGQQEPGSNAEIASFAKGRGATFPVLGKLDCGSTALAHPLYQYLTSSTGGALTWNFEKILCDANGMPVRRFSPRDSPLGMEAAILELLDNRPSEL
jgi:glutathione peroxidase